MIEVRENMSEYEDSFQKPLCLLVSEKYMLRVTLRVTFASADFLTMSGIVHFPGLWKQLETWHCGRQARHWLTLAAALQTLEL